MALLHVIEEPHNIREVFSGQPNAGDAHTNFSHLQSAAVGIEKSKGTELSVMRCLNHQNVEL